MISYDLFSFLFTIKALLDVQFCAHRWIKSLHPIRKRKGKWIPNEDKRLKVAVMFFGAKNWRNVAQYVPGRDHVQCRERCVKFLIRLSFLELNQVPQLHSCFTAGGKIAWILQLSWMSGLKKKTYG